MAAPWKERELQRREEEILRVARQLLLDHGYFGMTMDRIAAGIEYSKGTLYQHFASKEDVLCALALESEVKRKEFFERAAQFSGNARERMTAIGAAYELYFRLHPTYFRSEQMIHSQELLTKISQERRDQVMVCGARCHELMTGIIADAQTARQLHLPGGMTPGTLAFILWSLTSGAYLNMADPGHLEQMGVVNAIEAVRMACQTLLDGLGWRPLSSEHDYFAVASRAYAEIFPKETAEVFLAANR
ncbi:MAG: TetR/AcrR family transcriptional regulator [Verrucomicrobia bacterium]|nr:TetR/AcrR family transcriptional regulator [Verrucomicrobiota bacterium]